MGLETYIFKSKKEDLWAKCQEIEHARQQAFSKAMHTPIGVMLFDGQMNYMEKLNPDIEWVKFNHITAWFAEKVFDNPKGEISANIGFLTKDNLVALRKDCKKVLERCVMPDGKLKIDEKYCKKKFPYLDMAFSGSTEYDEWFIEEIKIAMQDIDKLLLTAHNPDLLFILYADF